MQVSSIPRRNAVYDMTSTTRPTHKTAEFRQMIGKILACRSGVAFIEFAYAMPFLMVLGMSGVELANIATANARVSAITSNIADGVARVRDRIDEVDINDVITGAQYSGQGINLTGKGRIIISTVEDNAATATPTTDQVITWQRCKGAKVVAAAQTIGTQGQILTSGPGPAGRQISARPGNPVIFVQVFYDYTPIFSSRLFGTITMRYSSAFSVRDRVVQTMQNAQNLSGANVAACNLYSA